MIPCGTGRRLRLAASSAANPANVTEGRLSEDQEEDEGNGKEEPEHAQQDGDEEPEQRLLEADRSTDTTTPCGFCGCDHSEPVPGHREHAGGHEGGYQDGERRVRERRDGGGCDGQADPDRPDRRQPCTNVIRPASRDDARTNAEDVDAGEECGRGMGGHAAVLVQEQDEEPGDRDLCGEVEACSEAQDPGTRIAHRLREVFELQHRDGGR